MFIHSVCYLCGIRQDEGRSQLLLAWWHGAAVKYVKIESEVVSLMTRRFARRDDKNTSQEESERQDVREAILDATENLLAQQRFDELSVADILSSAQVSRASFYFY